MKHQYSLAYLTIPGTHPVDQIHIAKEAGYDGVSLRTISMRLPGEPDLHLADTETLKLVKAALKETGMKCFDIELGRIGDGLNIMDYEAEIAVGKELGAEYIISSFWTPDREFAIREEQKLCDLAAKYDMKVNLEFMSFSNILDLADELDVIKKVDRPNLKLMVDLLHIYRAYNKPEELDDIPAELFGFAHICDGPAEIPAVEDPMMKFVAREGRLYMGEGGCRNADFLAHMPKVPYYSIELPNTAEMAVRGKLGHAKRCLETAQAICEKF